MPGSPSGDTAVDAPVSAPRFPDIVRGHRIMIEAEVIDAFADELRVSFETGNLRTTFWIPRKCVTGVRGFDEKLSVLDDEQAKSINLAAALA